MPPDGRPRPKFRGWKRTLLMVLLLLTGGAILNVAVAWAIMLSHGSRDAVIDDGLQYQSADERALTAAEDQWYCAKEQQWFPTQFSAFVDHGYTREARTAVDKRGIGWWQTAFIEHLRGPAGRKSPIRVGDKTIMAVGTGKNTAIVLGCAKVGWPGRSLFIAYGGESTTSLLAEPDRGWALPKCFGLFPRANEYVVPVDPVLPGFAINTLFYAAILWLLWITPGKVRRFVRVRQHRCPACGFIIAPRTCANGLCSECGAALPARWRE